MMVAGMKERNIYQKRCSRAMHLKKEEKIINFLHTKTGRERSSGVEDSIKARSRVSLHLRRRLVPRVGS
jgi:hypothetical protein